MKGKMINRLALLSMLLAIGLLMAGIGTALGAGNLLKLKPSKSLSLSVLHKVPLKNGSMVTIKEDGKVVKEITLPESSENYTIETSEGKIVIKKLSEEDMNKIKEDQRNLERWIEIANKDSRVRELTNGKGIQYKGEKGDYALLYAITTKNGKITPVGEPADTPVLAFKANGKIYKVTIDLESETVASVEEANPNVRGTCYKNGEQVACSELPR